MDETEKAGPKQELENHEPTVTLPEEGEPASSQPTAKDREAPRFLSDGSLVAGRYKILAKIGQGGMGAVYKVELTTLGSIQALKVLDARKSANRHYVRFQKEARALHRLNHRNLIRVYDFGLLEDDRPFFVMDFAEGKSLHELIKTAGRLTVSQALEIFLQVCDGLGYAHEHGIIHRDLKPANIVLMSDRAGNSVVKIVDFGIAKFVEGDEEQGLTRTGEIFGSPFYMSPEQGLGLKLDHRSDIYSVGCGLFEALTGMPPFAATAALHTMMQHQTEKPPTLKEVTLGEVFPDALEQIVAKLLAKEPADRYQSMAQLKHDLQLVAAGQSLEKQPSSPAKKIDVRAKLSKKHLLIALLAGIAITSVIIVMALVRHYCRPAQVATRLSADRLSESPFQSTSLGPEGKLTRDAKGSDIQSVAIDLRKYFAAVPLKQAKDGPWDLEFPAQSLGIISLPPGVARTTEGTRAQGHVHFSKAAPLVFTPNWTVCDKPHIFRHFRSDELFELEMTNNAAVTDDVFYFLDHLKDLHILRMDYDEVTDEGLAHIANLPDLIDLRLTNTRVTGAGLARMKSLKNWHILKASALKDMDKLVPALRSAKNLTAVNLRRDRLTDSDMAKLSLVQSITMLFIGDNRAVTNKGLEHLADLKHLHELDIWNCGITSASIPIFKRMPSLSRLHINLAEWSVKERMELKLAIPRCQLYTTANVEMR